MSDKKKEKKIERCKFADEPWKDTDPWRCTKLEKDTNEAECETCPHYKSKYVEYPITVNKIDVRPIKFDSWHCPTGTLVAVRPCGEEYGGKTYLGFFLGDLPTMVWPTFNSETGIISVDTIGNPAMFVPELGKIIWGAGSWWHEIKTEKDFRQISDSDIEGTWYVQLAKAMFSKQKKPNAVTLKVGDLFQQSWHGVKSPLAFRVLSIDRENNSLRVNVMGNGTTHEEEWDDLDTTEKAFDIGEYKMLESGE